MSTIVVKVLEALDLAGAHSPENAIVAPKLGVDHPTADADRVATSLAKIYENRRDLVGRAPVDSKAREELGVSKTVRFAYFLKKPLASIKFSPSGKIQQRKHRHGPTERVRRRKDSAHALTKIAEVVEAPQSTIKIVGKGIQIEMPISEKTLWAVLDLLKEPQ